MTKTDPVSFIRARFGKSATIAFMPNGGNLGDNLIAASTIQQFEKEGMAWRIMKGGRENILDTDVVVHGGGGSFVGLYDGGIASLKFLLTLGRPVVVLPQTVRDHFDFWQAAPYLTVFCRDVVSWNYMKRYPQIETFFADDMATKLDLSRSPYNTILKYRSELLQSEMPLPKLKAFRVDNEARSRKVSMGSIDLSELGTPTMQNRHDIDAQAATFLTIVASAGEITTDRLHVAVAGGLLGVPTQLFDNVYGKNHDIYEATLAEKFSSITLKKHTKTD